MDFAAPLITLAQPVEPIAVTSETACRQLFDGMSLKSFSRLVRKHEIKPITGGRYLVEDLRRIAREDRP